MADVQLSKGFTRIANELLQALIMFKLSGADLAICLAIIRLTYGFRRKKAQISLGMIAKLTGLNRATVWKRVKRLLEYKVLGRQKTRGKRTVDILWINKDYATWAVGLRAYSSVGQTAYSSVDQMADYIKKERNKERVKNFKKEFLGKTIIH